jgi:hypothetical protein
MDLLDQLRTLSTRIESNRALIQTEQATKNSMIMPFIQALGYNVFDPTEVMPELTADVGTKKAEKVDYAILKDGKPLLIIECKSCNSDLNIRHASQLFRYFHVTETRFAILTNGITYKFFTDLDQPNKMDEHPFLEFNVLSFEDSEVEKLKKFSKFAFNVESILATASNLKYTRAIRHTIGNLMLNPTNDCVKLIASDFLQDKQFTPAIKEQFSDSPASKRGALQHDFLGLAEWLLAEKRELTFSHEATELVERILLSNAKAAPNQRDWYWKTQQLASLFALLERRTVATLADVEAAYALVQASGAAYAQLVGAVEEKALSKTETHGWQLASLLMNEQRGFTQRELLRACTPKLRNGAALAPVLVEVAENLRQEGHSLEVAPNPKGRGTLYFAAPHVPVEEFP